jgi:general stress protein 26
MKKIPDKVFYFLERQSYTIVSTIDSKGSIRNSCKGIVKIDKTGSIYLFDLYKGGTFANLKKNPNISLTAVDEHKFIGYCIQGKAEIIKKENYKEEFLKEWENKIFKRVSKRLLKNIKGIKGHSKYPEFVLPEPKYLISFKISKIIDLKADNIKT